ncbi:luxR-family transcriptional regulatory domain protein [Yersinia rochesterensis]|nr:luxR-family transcriptional regulatory domain protein [Yersinia frederiksenii Y225]AJJ34207.1 luxR-family transcriptional regulatory domain protein [Yersinia rochesterensis]
MDEKNKPLNANKLIVESLNSLPLISIMEYSNEPWVIRDCESR